MQLTENSVGQSERFGATFIFNIFFGGWSFPESSSFLLDRTIQHFLIVQVQQPRGWDCSKYEDRLLLDYLLCESSSQHGHTHQWKVQETGWIPLKTESFSSKFKYKCKYTILLREATRLWPLYASLICSLLPPLIWGRITFNWDSSGKHWQMHNGPNSLSALTQSTSLFQNRSFNNLWNLGHTSAWFCLGKGEKYIE